MFQTSVMQIKSQIWTWLEMVVNPPGEATALKHLRELASWVTKNRGCGLAGQSHRCEVAARQGGFNVLTAIERIAPTKHLI